MSEFKPRQWQKDAANQCVSRARAGADKALIYACPGSGKTFAGLLIAKDLIARVKETQWILILTPNLAIKSQWIKRARAMGIDLREVRDGNDLLMAQAELFGGVRGFVVSYQQALNLQNSLRVFCKATKCIAILDEVHHTSTHHRERDGNAWGMTIQHALMPASFKIATTGTPFREGDNPIAFVDYDEEGKAIASHSYAYQTAIEDGVCRPIEFELFDGEIAWTTPGGQRRTADFEDPLTKDISKERLHAALMMDGTFPVRMLEAAHRRLMEVRGSGDEIDARAGAFVVGIDIKHAEKIAEALRVITGEEPVLAHSKLDDAQGQIDAFRDGDAKWIVGIGMLSEGVDIPRLRVGVYASKVTSPLYFHQFCGRFTRVQRDRRERSYIAIPSDPEIVAIAQEIERARCHALGEPVPVRYGRRGSGGVRRLEIEVEASDSEHVASLFGGLALPAEYLREHREKIRQARENSLAFRGLGDVEVAKDLIKLGVLPSPKEAA